MTHSSTNNINLTNSTCKVITIPVRKGGTAKTTTAISLACSLAKFKSIDGSPLKILVIDTDSQHSLTQALGIRNSNELPYTLTNTMLNIINQTDFDPHQGIISHQENIDLLPSNSSLANLELSLVSVIGRETILKQYIEKLKPYYDYIIIDTSPSANLLSLNALACADTVLIPVTPKYLELMGVKEVLHDISRIIGSGINPNLKIEGLLLTMANLRTKIAQEVMASLNYTYGSSIKIFDQHIPISIKVVEASRKGISILKHSPKSKVALAYENLAYQIARSNPHVSLDTPVNHQEVAHG